MKRYLLSTIAILFVCSTIYSTLAQQPVVSPPTQSIDFGPQKDLAVVPIGDAQGALMKSKLVTSQKLLAGLIRKDFDAIAIGAHDMKQISEAAEWPRARDEIYEHFGKTFRQQCAQLEELAMQRNNDGVTFMYLSMTNTCVSCHDHVRDSVRVAQPNQGDVRHIPSEWPLNSSGSQPSRQPIR
jgi:hypothetical protein